MPKEKLKDKSKLFCSFCRKSAKELPSLIAGPGVHICGDCVGMCNKILAGLKREEEKLSAFLQRWKEEGNELVHGGEQALALLRGVDKRSAVVNQLGETSLLINDQAKNNLQRWN